MTKIYAKLLNQYDFKCQLTFSVLFKKFGEDDEIISEIGLAITLSFTNNLTKSEIDTIKIQWTLENKEQNVETKESGWNQVEEDHSVNLVK